MVWCEGNRDTNGPPSTSPSLGQTNGIGLVRPPEKKREWEGGGERGVGLDSETEDSEHRGLHDEFQ